MNGDRWKLPDGREALEVRRVGEQIVVCPIAPDWPWPGRPEVAALRFCTLLGSKYLGGALPAQGPTTA